MDNGQKYLGVGIGTAIAIAVFVKAFSTLGLNSNSWLMILGLISIGMMYLVFNIFQATKRLAPAVEATGNADNDKSRNFNVNK